MKTMIKHVAIAYFSSRTLVFLIILACSGLEFVPGNADGTGSVSAITVSEVGVEHSVSRLATMNDAGWYHGIAVSGYERREFDRSKYANWAFFPLHPLTWRAVIGVFGDSPVAEVVVTNLFFLLALFFVYRVVVE